MNSISDSIAPSHFLESGPIIASMSVMSSSLPNNNMSHCSMVRSVNFSVVRCALIDLREAGASISSGTISCTSCMGSVGAKTFFGVS
jgi:hypothetical protein